MARPRTCRSRPLGRRRAVCCSSPNYISMKFAFFVYFCLQFFVHFDSDFVSTLSPPASAQPIWGPPSWLRDLGLTWERSGRARGRASSDGMGSGKNSPTTGTGMADAHTRPAARPAGRGGAERGRGGAGTESGSLAALGSCAVWSLESGGGVWSGGLGQIFARATPNKRQFAL